MSARYFSRGESIDYTPAVDTKAGDIVFVGELACVAKLDIPANTLGALATCGVFCVAKGAETFALGAKVYVGADGKATATEGSNKLFGTAIKAAAENDAEVIVLINK